MNTIEHVENIIDFGTSDIGETAKVICKAKEDFEQFLKGEIKELVLKNTTVYSDENMSYIRIGAPILSINVAQIWLEKMERDYAAQVETMAKNSDKNSPIVESVKSVFHELMAVRDELVNLWQLMPALGNFNPVDFKFHAKAMTMLATYIDLLSKFADLQDYLMKMKEFEPPKGMAAPDFNFKMIEETLFKTPRVTKH